MTSIPIRDIRRNSENINCPGWLSVGKDASQANAIIPSIKDKAASIRMFFRMEWILLQSVVINSCRGAVIYRLPPAARAVIRLSGQFKHLTASVALEVIQQHIIPLARRDQCTE